MVWIRRHSLCAACLAVGSSLLVLEGLKLLNLESLTEKDNIRLDLLRRIVLDGHCLVISKALVSLPRTSRKLGIV